MGACMSSPEKIEATEVDQAVGRESQKHIEEAKAKPQVKVLLLGAGGSGKTTLLKQLHLIHCGRFSSRDIETYRQLVFNNLTRGLTSLLYAMEDMGLEVSEENLQYINVIVHADDIGDGEPFSMTYYQPLQSLWTDINVQKAWERGSEVALTENLSYFFSSLDRLFHPAYRPTTEDIVQCNARTLGISEMTFSLRGHELLVVDTGGQKSERRKWVNCFKNVASILFLVSLNGYDQCMMEDLDSNQMQDAMLIWESICRSKWFLRTSIILFLNKNDLFERKVPNSDIKKFFPDFDGEPGDVQAGRDYFRRRFAQLANPRRSIEREIHIHVITATDTGALGAAMTAVEGWSRLRHTLLPIHRRFLTLPQTSFSAQTLEPRHWI